MGKFGYTSNMDSKEKLMIAIVRVSEAYKKDCSSIFSAYGLTFAQYTVIRVLDGSDNGRNTMGNVSKIMLVSGSNITPIAKRLEKNGFLVKRHDPNDDRLTILEITDKGRQIIEKIEVDKNILVEKYLSRYTQNDIDESLSKLKYILKSQIY